jgi:hypothetical protein
MSLYERGNVMTNNRRVVSDLLAERPNDLFDLDLYLTALDPFNPGAAPYVTEYLEFLRQLRKTFTGCSFTMGGKYRDDGGWEIQSYDDMAKSLYEAYRLQHVNLLRSHKVFLYVPTNRYTSGWVGLSDFRMHDRDDYNPKIGVWSEHISNYNTANSEMQHSLKTTTTATRALKLAKTYFREEDRGKVALHSVGNVRGAITTDRRAVEELVQIAKMKFTSHGAFPAAIEWLVDSGYEFNDKGLEDEMRTYVTELKYKTEAIPSQKYPNLIYVRGYLKDGEQVFDQVRLKHTHNDSSFILDQILETCNEEDLSEDTKRKLSILMMSEDDSFVAGVGYKYDGEIYYVFE